MDVQQKSTTSEVAITENQTAVEPAFELTPQHEQYIAFVALGGLIPDPEGGAGKRLTATSLADQLGVDRTTLYTWRSRIPNFWDKVAEKRKELGGRDRVSAVWNGIYLKAAAGNADAAKIYLKNFDDNYVDPAQKVEHDLGTGFADLIAAHRNRQIKERNVIDVDSNES